MKSKNGGLFCCISVQWLLVRSEFAIVCQQTIASQIESRPKSSVVNLSGSNTQMWQLICPYFVVHKLGALGSAGGGGGGGGSFGRGWFIRHFSILTI